MISIYAVHDPLHLNIQSFSKGAASRDRDAEGHRIRILTHLDIVEKTLTTRLQFIVNNDGFISLTNAHSCWFIVEWIDAEGPEPCWC